MSTAAHRVKQAGGQDSGQAMANKHGGFVKVYRSLLDHQLMNQLPAAWFKIFLFTLLSVNWKRGTWWDGSRQIEIPEGSFVTSIEKISARTATTSSQVRGALRYLKATDTATITTTKRYTIISLRNWESYQVEFDSRDTLDDTPDDTVKTQSEQSNRNNIRRKERKTGKKKDAVYTASLSPAHQKIADRIYESHPQKSGRREFEQALANAINEAIDPDKLITEIQRKHSAWLPTWEYRDDVVYVPNLANWIKGKRWEDADPGGLNS